MRNCKKNQGGRRRVQRARTDARIALENDELGLFPSTDKQLISRFLDALQALSFGHGPRFSWISPLAAAAAAAAAALMATSILALLERVRIG